MFAQKNTTFPSLNSLNACILEQGKQEIAFQVDGFKFKATKQGVIFSIQTIEQDIRSEEIEVEDKTCYYDYQKNYKDISVVSSIEGSVKETIITECDFSEDFKRKVKNADKTLFSYSGINMSEELWELINFSQEYEINFVSYVSFAELEATAKRINGMPVFVLDEIFDMFLTKFQKQIEEDIRRMESLPALLKKQALDVEVQKIVKKLEDKTILADKKDLETMQFLKFAFSAVGLNAPKMTKTVGSYLKAAQQFLKEEV